jgi:hypothetical protein
LIFRGIGREHEQINDKDGEVLLNMFIFSFLNTKIYDDLQKKIIMNMYADINLYPSLRVFYFVFVLSIEDPFSGHRFFVVIYLSIHHHHHYSYIYINVYIYIYVCIFIYIFTYAKYICIYLYLCIHMYVYICIHIYKHTYINIHTYIYILGF